MTGETKFNQKLRKGVNYMGNKRKEFDELNLNDNFMFANVMSDKVICRMFLEKLLGIEIAEIEIAEYEKTILAGITSKDIRIDVYAKDSRGKVYDIEMQNSSSYSKYNLAKRARYYQSVIDTEELKEGKHYNELPESYIIFVCSFDEFECGRSKYTFRYRCDEEPDLVLQNETNLIILNTKGTEKDAELDFDIAAFLRYLENSDARMVQASGSEFLTCVHKRFEHIKKEKRDEYMTLQELIDIEKEEAVKEANLETAIRMKEAGCDNVFISKMTGIPIEAVETL